MAVCRSKSLPTAVCLQPEQQTLVVQLFLGVMVQIRSDTATEAHFLFVPSNLLEMGALFFFAAPSLSVSCLLDGRDAILLTPYSNDPQSHRNVCPKIFL